ANHTASFGTSCAAGSAPAGDATGDWQPSGDTAALNVTGDLCLQKTKDTYRVELREYYLDSKAPGGEALVALVDSRALTGNNGGLNTSSVNLQLPRLQSATIHHAHLVLQMKDSTGAWQDVLGGVAYLNLT